MSVTLQKERTGAEAAYSVLRESPYRPGAENARATTSVSAAYTPRRPDPVLQDKWSRMLDRLICWVQGPNRMDDEDFTVTTREIVARAYQTGRALCDFGFPHPTRIVPDGFGGVSFQWDGKSVPIHVSFVVTPDSQLETKIFVNCKLKLSATMPLDDLLVVLSNA